MNDKDKDCKGGRVRRDDYGFFIGMICKNCNKWMDSKYIPPHLREANHEGAIYSEWTCPTCGCTAGHVESPYREF